MSALLSAARGTLPAEPLLAFRYDESHMIVVLEDLSRYRREELESP